MPRTIEVCKEILSDLTWGHCAEGYAIVSNEHIDSSRWSSNHDLVFRYQDTLWGVGYSQGLTECQDESPFEYDDDLITCTEQEEYEVVTKRYRTKEGPDES